MLALWKIPSLDIQFQSDREHRCLNLRSVKLRIKGSAFRAFKDRYLTMGMTGGFGMSWKTQDGIHFINRATNSFNSHFGRWYRDPSLNVSGRCQGQMVFPGMKPPNLLHSWSQFRLVNHFQIFPLEKLRSHWAMECSTSNPLNCQMSVAQCGFLLWLLNATRPTQKVSARFGTQKFPMLFQKKGCIVTKVD